MEDLIRRGLAKSFGGSSKDLISAYEAERLIQLLHPIDISEVGSSRWMEQHDSIEKLNLQAHKTAQQHADEYVVEALLSHNKLPVLVHQLLVAEIWKDNMLPLLAGHLAASMDSVTAYQLLYHETVVANLLEICMFHPHACQALPDDALLELCDWCYRKLVHLNTCKPAHPPLQESREDLLAKSGEAELDEKREELDFGTALCALTIVRYLTDNVATLPLGISTRLLTTNDTVMALLPLVEKPPWSRRVKKQEQRYTEGAWRDLPAADRLLLTQHDAQVWLALNNLVVEPGCRARVLTNSHRCEALLRLRRHMTDPLLDQLPVLQDLRRVLSEVALGLNSCPPDAALQAPFIIEQVPMMREALLNGRDWGELTAQQKTHNLGPDSQAAMQRRMQAMVEAFDFMCDMQPDQAAGAEGEGAGEERVDERIRCRFWRHVRDDAHEEWSDMAFEVDPAQAVEEVEVRGSDTCSVTGSRRRLKSVDMAGSKPLPCNGKVEASFRGCSAAARLELPTASTRAACAEELAAVGWLTVGILAMDGFALQLRLRRADQPTVRDKAEGAWLAYHAVGGAVTVLSGGEKEGIETVHPPKGPLAF